MKACMFLILLVVACGKEGSNSIQDVPPAANQICEIGYSPATSFGKTTCMKDIGQVAHDVVKPSCPAGYQLIQTGIFGENIQCIWNGPVHG